MRRRLNGFGELLRYVTPVLVTIALFILGDIRDKVRDATDKIDGLVPRVAVVEAKVGHLERSRP